MPKMNSASTIETVKMSISGMSDDDITILLRIVNGEREHRMNQKRFTLRIGSTYKFTDKFGREVQAELISIGPKNCKLVQVFKDAETGVTIDRVRWTVHPSFIKGI